MTSRRIGRRMRASETQAALRISTMAFPARITIAALQPIEVKFPNLHEALRC